MHRYPKTLQGLRDLAFNERCPHCNGHLSLREGDRFASGEQTHHLRCVRCWVTLGAYYVADGNQAMTKQTTR